MRALSAAVLALVGLMVVPAPAPVSARAPAPSQLVPCKGVPGARCDSIRRPLDPADPAAGTIKVSFEVHRAKNRPGNPAGTIVAVEGGPGYATTASRDYYLDLFAPLLDTHQLLLVDNRGTGRSSAIDCPELQSYEGDYIRNVNRGRIGIGTFDVSAELAAAEATMTAAKAGKDPFKARTGDMERHYVLDGANEIMPYRVYVPTT